MGQSGKPLDPRTIIGHVHLKVSDLVPDCIELARVLHRLNDHNWPLDGAADHGVSEALYLHDPDGNGIEICADRPREAWPRDASGEIVMYTHALDFDSLLQELDEM